MAQVVLEGVGQAVGGAYGAAIGGLIGRGVDQALIASLEAPRQRGPRLDGLKLQGTSEGAPIPFVLGRARLVGQVIWAARFREDRDKRSGGKGGAGTVGYGYSLSFAVALCEGRIDGIGRIWADGQLMNLSGVTWRVHRGGETQEPDPLIEAVEGHAPAYRGTAYVVFEDLHLGPFGNRLPQLSFEVFRRAGGSAARLEDRVEGVCLIPGAGEFLLATEPVFRREGLTRTTAENLHGGGRSDLSQSLDLLQARLPNLRRVSLVIGWFGDDLRAAHCRIRPGVERREKPTEPLVWSVAGRTRADAHLISDAAGGPAYGGTPSDTSVRQAVAELRSRGLEVTLYPFVFMDIPPGSGRPAPDGAAEQPPYPWRGRVEGRSGPDAAADIDAVFGADDGWGLRRLALHYATLARETGAQGLLIGSEMRGLTMTHDGAGGFPAVEALRRLAADCRAIVGPSVKLSYAADWSEYGGVRANEEVRFHLDPLWADPNIDYVGIDWYPPLADWREGSGGVDGRTFMSADDPSYLAGQIAGGEGFDWFYANAEDRATQFRTPIRDGLAGEDWVFRVKDLAGWWGHQHHDRTDGTRADTPTAWQPGMKPIRLVECGCAAVDRGANAPNLFLDPKSAESALPPQSTGERDDRMQRRALEAVLGHFAHNNPVSDVYDGPMLEAADVWCWDARPWPAFPALQDVWADAAGWRTGHWLNGRLEGETRDLIAALAARNGGPALQIGPFVGEVHGYVVDRPMTARDALQPLMAALGLSLVERMEGLALVGEGDVVTTLLPDAMALPDDGGSIRKERVLEAAPGSARVRFIDGVRDYQTGAVSVLGLGDGGLLHLDVPAVCDISLARMAANRALQGAAVEQRVVMLGPVDALRLEPGDNIRFGEGDEVWRLAEIDYAEQVSATMVPVVTAAGQVNESDISRPDVMEIGGAPFIRMLELPPLPGDELESRPVAVVAASPWRRMEVRAGRDADSLTPRGEIPVPATVGVLLQPPGPGRCHRWNVAQALTVRIEGDTPQSRTVAAVLAGANTVAVETPLGWEIVQFRRADMVGEGIWRLSDLLRGQFGSEGEMRAGATVGGVVTFLDARPQRVQVAVGEQRLPLTWRAGPIGTPGGPAVAETIFGFTGLHARPWSPARLKCRRHGNGSIDVGWVPRSRLWGDSWDGEDRASDPLRFRVRLADGDAVRREIEVTDLQVFWSAEQIAADFPDGVDGHVTVSVAQWGDGYGWGQEASLKL
ncbi:baseplate multidomain protein megatron [Brevundimonas sp. FT23042]|uniref:baseplate multidomain protein megatron n=1 Tax=Brevundimonas sp. FT23042 TaxID=3393749 RepID=UPI003B589289